MSHWLITFASVFVRVSKIKIGIRKAKESKYFQVKLL